MATTSTNLESAIETVVRNFYTYAHKKGKEYKMNKADFHKMVEQELQHVLTNTENKEALKKLSKKFDADNDGKISFDEYWKLIGEIGRNLGHQMAMQG
ncbi:PREDICTED: protein S100-A16-like [Nanorana parkeri]|uniref:protein S100-A16-like n=1 Tax=Nanorana parkeri TaxID=125878 RepID=UPI0008542E50|nr:PREDICTED: protein S100-A16-like [Nanorana parkeri]